MRTLKSILITCKGTITDAQAYPFTKYKAELEEEFNFVFEHIKVSDTRELKADICRRQSDIVFIQDRCLTGMTFTETIDFLGVFEGKARTVFLDSFASTYAKGFRVLPYVDLYVKKSLFRNLNLHGNHYLDGRIFSDYLIRTGHLKATFTSGIVLDKRHSHKIVLGWNIGSQEDLDKEFSGRNYQALLSNNRTIDIHCRVQTHVTPVREWYSFHRNLALKELNEMASEHMIVATDSKIPWIAYLNELRKSKITVSPFGWGEICLRDFEAVVCGSLLIKPSMEHLHTLPNIYVSEKTYVPVKWDFSDLKEKCDYYLRNNVERNNIVNNAERQYATYFQEKLFIRKIGEILDKLELN